VWACAAGVGDQIKAGKWEFSTLVPGTPYPALGMQPSPGVRSSPTGLSISQTVCITAADPLPPMARGPSARGPKHPCKVDKTDINGSTVGWSVSCAMPQININVEGVVHYHEATLDGEYTVRSAIAGRAAPAMKTIHLTGRYLGPCDSK